MKEPMDMNRSLTERQQSVYQFIREKILTRGYGPTVREIGEEMSISSPNGVMCHLRALEKKGMIKRDANKSRAIELIQAGSPLRRSAILPMVGRVAAGQCSMACEQDESIDLSELFVRDDRFALEVTGDSMIDAHIADGDYVIVQKQSYAYPGQIVVAQTTEHEATLKYWFPENGRIRLQPANRNMQPIYVDEAAIQGIVIGVVRRFR
jgi:repressor LexA